jgi:hypothetical protein
MWTAFDYMYRDAGNFKACGTIILKGYLSATDRKSILGRLDTGEFFVAEQVGVPTLYEELYQWSAGPTVSDHCWHSFIGFRKLSSAPEQGIPLIDVASFVSRFKAVTEWDGSLSPHFELN